jgi:hypothetical protein
MKEIDELVKIAHNLDLEGEFDKADELTEIIKKIAKNPKMLREAGLWNKITKRDKIDDARRGYIDALEHRGFVNSPSYEPWLAERKPIMLNLKDGDFTLYTAIYGSSGDKIPFIVREGMHPQTTAKALGIKNYDDIAPASRSEIRYWIANHMDLMSPPFK